MMIQTGGELKGLVSDYRSGNITIPPPTEKVKTWPLIGTKAYGLWSQAATNLDSLIASNPEQAKAAATTVVGALTGTAKGILFFLAAIIISGVFLCYATPAGNFARSFFNRLINSTKIDMASISVVTVRNVVKGILGVAFVQTVLMGAGMIIGGVPYAGVLILLCFVLAVVQIGTLPVAIIVIIYAWSAEPTLTAILLTIWVLAIGVLDNVLKPLVMGKGAPVPMLVIFLGAIGGFMLSGFIGLFTGAVILSLGYRLFDVWLTGVEI
jgi:predicted PurR-regulated permease PerM